MKNWSKIAVIFVSLGSQGCKTLAMEDYNLMRMGVQGATVVGVIAVHYFAGRLIVMQAIESESDRRSEPRGRNVERQNRDQDVRCGNSKADKRKS